MAATPEPSFWLLENSEGKLVSGLHLDNVWFNGITRRMYNAANAVNWNYGVPVNTPAMQPAIMAGQGFQIGAQFGVNGGGPEAYIEVTFKYTKQPRFDAHYDNGVPVP